MQSGDGLIEVFMGVAPPAGPISRPLNAYHEASVVKVEGFFSCDPTPGPCSLQHFASTICNSYFARLDNTIVSSRVAWGVDLCSHGCGRDL